MKAALFALAFLLTPSAWGQELAPMALNSFTTPPFRIASAQVETPNGQAVGPVERVITDAEGKLSALAVRSPQGTLIVRAISASYDQTRNLVVADIPSRQIANSGH